MLGNWALRCTRVTAIMGDDNVPFTSVPMALIGHSGVSCRLSARGGAGVGKCVYPGEIDFGTCDVHYGDRRAARTCSTATALAARATSPARTAPADFIGFVVITRSARPARTALCAFAPIPARAAATGRNGGVFDYSATCSQKIDTEGTASAFSAGAAAAAAATASAASAAVAGATDTADEAAGALASASASASAAMSLPSDLTIAGDGRRVLRTEDPE